MAENDYVFTLRIVSWVLGGFTTSVCSARICARTLLIHHAGWDDIFMALATASALTCSALVTVGTQYGLGKHMSSIANPNDRINATKYTVIAPAFSIIASTCAKISIVVFLLRLMGMAASRRHRAFLWGMSGLMVGFNLFAIIAIIGFCRPMDRIWDRTVEGWCMSPDVQLYGGIIQSGYNALMDIVAALFPILVIAKLNISRNMKIGLCFLMGGGVFAAVATIVKAYMIRNITQQTDITWAWASITLWYTAEMDAIIIFGSIPTLWPLRRLFKNKSASQSGGNRVFKNATSLSEHPEGSEAIRLSSLKLIQHRPGPTTLILQESDEEVGSSEL